MKNVPHRIYLTEDQMPRQWYNLRADMKEQPDPMINPATGRPATEEDLYPVFCKELAHQEMDSQTRYVDIPEPVQRFYRMYRPSPLIRAYELEKALDTPARIYYKFEGNNTSGSHKLNSAAAQVYYAKQQGLSRSTWQLMIREFSAGTTSLTDIIQLERQLLDYSLKKSEAVAEYNTLVAGLEKLVSTSVNE